MSYWESDPLLFAYDATGALVHIDTVPNGNSCGCICPGCKQPLIAKNGGQKLIHHFAHKKGACRWAVETTVIMIARGILEEHKTMTVSGAGYFSDLDEIFYRFPPTGKLDIHEVELIEAEGRKAPALKITCTDEFDRDSVFVLVPVVAHRVSEEQLAYLQEQTEKGVVLALDLKRVYSGMRDKHGRHFSRGEFYLQAQNPDNLKSLLLDDPETSFDFNEVYDGTDALHWLARPRRDEHMAENREEYYRQCEERWRAEKEEIQRAIEEMERAFEEEERRIKAEAAEEEAKRAQDKAKRKQETIATEQAAFEAEGVETLPIVRDGVRLCADGCPIHGRADIAFDCGDILGNDDRCIFFEGRRYYLIGCTAHQNGVGLEDDEEEMDGCEVELDDGELADALVAKALEAYND